MEEPKEQRQAPLHAQVHNEWLTEQAIFAPRTQYVQALPQQGVLAPGQEHIIMARESNVLLWVIEDVKHLTYTESDIHSEHAKARMYLVPSGMLLHLVADAEWVRYLTLEFHAHPALCMGQCPAKDAALRSGRSSVSGDYRHRPRREAARVSDLPISQGIHLWISSVEKLLGHGDVGLHMYDYKLQEFFLLLRLDYTRALVDEFLRHYHCRVSGFRKRIISSYTTDMEVADLYAIGEEMQLNEVAFKRSFIEEFSMSPRSWVTLQRSRYIYNELVTSDAPISEIGERFGFCSMSYFSLFCKTNLGGTPMQIRKHRRQMLSADGE